MQRQHDHYKGKVSTNNARKRVVEVAYPERQQQQKQRLLLPLLLPALLLVGASAVLADVVCSRVRLNYAVTARMEACRWC